MNSPLALLDRDPEGGFNVLDSRSGRSLAWRGEVEEAASVAAFLNASYPSADHLPPAHDSLTHEVAMWRVAGDPEGPLSEVDVRRLIPDAIDGEFALWKPGGQS